METIYAVIMAGGRGTRLGDLTNEIPKPMVKVCGVPIIERQIKTLKEQGIINIFITINYLGDVICNYFKDGSDFGVNIEYIKEEMPLGTAGALFYLKSRINDDFILLFGDLIEDVDFLKIIQFHKENQSLVTLFAHPNSHPFDSDLLIVDKCNHVIDIDSKNNTRNYYYHNLVNAGIYACSPLIFKYIDSPRKIDFEKNIIAPLLNSCNIFAYISSEYVKDVGTLDRLKSVEDDIKKGVVAAKNLSKLQKAIFLDRDGTINLLKGFLTKIDDFELISNVDKAIRLINKSQYLAICITNQPVIARGEITFDELYNIHYKMETLLGQNGAYLDDLFFCPHHPDKGFPYEVKEFKIDCDCRKPKIGMLIKAEEKYNIDLTKSWFIGDSNIDIQTGINGGCRTIYIGNNPSKLIAKPNFVCKDLFEAIKIILNKSEDLK